MLRTLVFVTLALFMSGPSVPRENWSVEEFIAATGVREAAVPVRELAGWRPDPTILYTERFESIDDLARDFPEATFISADGPAHLIERAAEADVIIGHCSEASVGFARKLVWLQIYSSGAERCLSVDALQSSEVLLTNMQKMSAPAIGEHAVAMILSLTRGLVQYSKAMPDGQWRRNFIGEPGMYSVGGKTLLVVGLGGIGSATAQRAKALGMHVTATRNSSREKPPWVDYVGLADELEDLARAADVVVNALPLTPATRDLFDEELFGKMKKGAYFINVGRGGTVVTDALVAALDSGHLAGAGLDVTAPEPLPADHPLWQMPNVIITPHVSSAGADRRFHRMLLRENIRRYLAGDALLNVVDPARGY